VKVKENCKLGKSAAHRAMGGSLPKSKFYTMAPEIGIAAGLVQSMKED